MGQLIDDLLSFSRVGRAEINRTVINMRSLVEQVRETLTPALNGRNVRWHIGTLPEVEGDPAMLRQVFVSLLDNALKFTAHARVCRDRNRRTPGAAGACLSSCATTAWASTRAMRTSSSAFSSGCIPAPNSRAPASGSPVCAASFQRHNGSSWAERFRGEGTVVYFSLPLSTAADEHTH
jgi:signal transduction histidine kinase